LNINTEFLKGALEIMGFGMGGIFAVLGILYLVSLGLLKFFPVKK
jgi:Na+-transporting methylmalonyl-CoA/oxaloacetate decarboxylase gamma subunit